MRYLQQGDVLVKNIKGIPVEAQRVEHKVLQSTPSGNAHRFDGNAAVNLFETPAGVKYLDVLSPSMLRHEEHKHFEVPAGQYEIDICREYNYEADEMRRVVD